MIPVVVGQRNQVYFDGADLFSSEGDLGAFPAVEENAAPGAAQYGRAQPSFRGGHGGPASQ